MLTDAKIVPKLARIEERYTRLFWQDLAPIEVEYCETLEHFRSEPGPESGVDWRPCSAGTTWGGDWITGWFAGDAVVPDVSADLPLYVRADTGADEALLFVDSVPRGVFDSNHTAVRLPADLRPGDSVRLGVEAYAKHSFPGTQPDDHAVTVPTGSKTFASVRFSLLREDIMGFVFDLCTLRQLCQVLDEHSLRKHRVLNCLSEVFALVYADPGTAAESEWRPCLSRARDLMAPLLSETNSATVPFMGVVGHSHIDTAWLWPLAETERKCARTFASVLTLMEQYPDFLFVQSAPCHASMVRRHYPALFERMVARCHEGRWEPNGGMWVEPDCNIPSGESLVRQCVLGQRTTRTFFGGYTADTLWMPDVFGYSAALPQILQGCGIRFFCTTKIGWNDTTRFPYDTFSWQGIDGSRVTTHYNVIHCRPDPETFTNAWRRVQHKDVQDRVLISFGYGDGGGGPQFEMLEAAARVRDLEGCPRSAPTTVSAFMNGIDRDLGDRLPVWVGELYLEAHRGTLTSVSGIKRGNRKTEFALREAEFLCTLASLSGAGYPVEQLADAWEQLLTLQFHDILPGSSIARVNDEALEGFDQCVAEAGRLTESAAAHLTGADPTVESTRLLLINPLSWERQTSFVLEGVPEQTVPECPGARCQWIEGVDGRRRLAVSGFDLPALGGRVLALTVGEPELDSAFAIDGNTVETPFARVEFDRFGRIVSLRDRGCDREIVAEDGALNTFWLGEDVPQSWDNWDIDSDQHLKMEREDHLLETAIMADGPLQLRLRRVYAIGQGSRLTQDMVFHADTAQIDFETVLDWEEKHRLLKVGFELAVTTETARHEIQYGHVERPTHTNHPQDRARFEVCAHKWTDLSDNGFGVALLNDCKYGLSVRENELRLSLVKSGVHPDPRGDAGRHYFTYSLVPHSGTFSVPSVVRPAYELNSDILVVPAGRIAEGICPLVEVDAESVIVEAVKWADEEEAFVLRLFEAGRGSTRARLRFGTPVAEVLETDMLEENGTQLDIDDHSVEVCFGPFEIKTLVCRLP